MEEAVGALYHRIITRLARSGHPQAAVTLGQMKRRLAILFRAWGGDAGLAVEATDPTRHGARRRWLQRIAGTGQTVELAWRDGETLFLPARIDLYPDRALNERLYVWLAALAAQPGAGDGFAGSQGAVQRLLAGQPGLWPDYRSLVAAELARRPDPDALPADEARLERAIRQALRIPGSLAGFPTARRPPVPVPLWLHPLPPLRRAAGRHGEAAPEDTAPNAGTTRDARDGRRRRAERVAMPRRDQGLLALRFESIFGWAEYADLDRGTEDNEDLDQARRDADDLEQLSLARDHQRPASRLRFDLDLPSAADDDACIGPGIRVPEWDWKHQCLHRDHCRIQPMVALDAPPAELPAHLHATARRLRRRFMALAPARVWRHGLAEGEELDIDAYLRYRVDRQSGRVTLAPNLYRGLEPGGRDLACLLLADLSLSTDTWVDDRFRVIDVIRDSLFLFAESLAATGDRFGLFGFSSRRRDPVRFHLIKGFSEAYDARVRGRIAALRPGFYTRMGAAIRHAAQRLAQQPANRRLLLLLTDGKPNDIDCYEGRYGVEDTRHAVLEARRQGILPFCITVDEKGTDYLPYLFGTGHYLVIRHPLQLPSRLPLLYARLTA